MLDVLAHGHAAELAARDGDTFAAIVASLDAGLKCLDTAVSSQCAAAVDSLAAWYFKGMAAEPAAPGVDALAAHAAARPSLFPSLLATLFEVVMLEDCPNQVRGGAREGGRAAGGGDGRGGGAGHRRVGCARRGAPCAPPTHRLYPTPSPTVVVPVPAHAELDSGQRGGV